MFHFEPVVGLRSLGSGDLWSFDLPLDEFFRRALEMPELRSVRDQFARPELPSSGEREENRRTGHRSRRSLKDDRLPTRIRELNAGQLLRLAAPAFLGDMTELYHGLEGHVSFGIAVARANAEAGKSGRFLISDAPEGALATSGRSAVAMEDVPRQELQNQAAAPSANVQYSNIQAAGREQTPMRRAGRPSPARAVVHPHRHR